MFVNVYWTVWKCAAQAPYPGLVDRVLDGLNVAPGIYHVAGGLDMAVAASVLCLVLYAALMLFSYVKLGFDARLGKASVMACAGIAAGLLFWLINSIFPLYDIGMGWLLPASIGFVLGLVLKTVAGKKAT